VEGRRNEIPLKLEEGAQREQERGLELAWKENMSPRSRILRLPDWVWLLEIHEKTMLSFRRS
jgi:hypothetical protein